MQPPPETPADSPLRMPAALSQWQAMNEALAHPTRPPTDRRRQMLVGLAVALVVVVMVTALGVALTSGTFRGTSSTGTLSTTTSLPAATATPTLAPTPTPATVPALSIKGTQIVDATGKTVLLLGATRSSLEYECKGDGHFQVADFQAMKTWGMNVVRIPLWSKYWLHQDPSDPCLNYQQTVAAAVANAEAVGFYVIIDLHWNAPSLAAPEPNRDGSPNHQYDMPDVAHDLPFWQAVAAIYKDDPHVIFEPYAEPHYISWSTWLNGGMVTSISGYAYQAIGMQALTDAIRAIAPHTLLILSGNDWGYDLSGIPTYHVKGTNILYGTHPFNYLGKQAPNWPNNFGNVAHSYPVIATEFGSYDCKTTYNTEAIHYFNQLHISWLAWEWGSGACDGSSGPYLISDWSGTPAAPYGQYIHDQMLALSKSAGA